MKTQQTTAWRRLLTASLIVAAPMSALADSAVPMGESNTAAQQALLDASSHHTESLRSLMAKPHYTIGKMGKEMPDKRSNAWIVYDGGYDSLNGSSGMSDYTRGFQGLMLGMDKQYTPSMNLGIAFGYERSIARQSPTRVDSDIYTIDLYSGVKTGNLDHKFIVGVGLHDMDSRRLFTSPDSDAAIRADGSADAYAINVGYELSRTYELTDHSSYTPFLTVDYAYISADDMQESGAGSSSLRTDYGSMNLLQAGLGIAYNRSFCLFPSRQAASMSIYAKAAAEFSKHQPSITNTLADDGGSARLKGIKREPIFGQIGMHVNIPVSAGTDMVMGAYGRLGEDRLNVAGNVGFNCRF